jgi:nucleotide-binding universal stress UspA family protein
LHEIAARVGVDLDVRVRRGEEPWREIVDEARARGADLVIARRRGKRSFFAHLMVGEMVGKVATAAPCSVLLVPRAAHVWSRRVLAGVDGSRSGVEVARTAARMALAARLPLTVATVASNDTVSERTAADAVVAAAVATARAEGADVDGQATTGRPADTIAALAESTGADLLVVGRGGPEAHGRLHLGSNAQHIAGLAVCAVLVVKS